MAPLVIRTFSAGSGLGAFEEYNLAKFERSFCEPRIGPYVSLVDSDRGDPPRWSLREPKSSTEIEAAQVSAMLYLAVVSYSSIH